MLVARAGGHVYQNLLSDPEQMELMQLAQELNALAVSRTHPNPYFEQFANAMAKQVPKPEAGLTKDEIDAQAKLADKVLTEILAEEKATRGNEQE